MADDFNVRIEWDGFDEVRQNLRRYTKAAMDALIAAMIENVEDLLGRAMKDAPIDEGTLRGSGSARVNRGTTAKSQMETDENGNITHTLQTIEGSDTSSLIDLYGNPVVEGEVGFNTPYAAYQHEHTEFQHPHGGKAKYLEDNLKKMIQEYVKNLAEHVREVGE